MQIEIADQGFLLFMAESLLEQTSALTRETQGVIEAKDIEHIHHMRVASRRLRTRLELFENFLPDKKASEWRKQIKRITRALGNARDMDVQIKFLQDFLKQTTDEKQKPGLKRILLRFCQSRGRLQRKVVKAIEQLQSSTVVEDMEVVLRQTRIHARLHPPQGPSAFFYSTALQAISAKLEEMLSWEVYVRQPEKIKELHAMRIAAKHLRYTLETFGSHYPGELNDFIKTVRKIQDFLGDIHDCDVWIGCLPQFLKDERERALQYSGSARGIGRLGLGIKALEKNRQALREKEYSGFGIFWEELQSGGYWKKLLKMLEKHLIKQPAVPQPPLKKPEADKT